MLCYTFKINEPECRTVDAFDLNDARRGPVSQKLILMPEGDDVGEKQPLLTRYCSGCEKIGRHGT